ncbi:MAG TPA: tetratricopeptide repeat protein [Cyclobacteriaceae bacterium]|jgi:tetratricopeptide (TPR) repeat protein|nr:tetratricopeptide repeat protein [Cyclobacteriaceae bacterium]
MSAVSFNREDVKALRTLHPFAPSRLCGNELFLSCLLILVYVGFARAQEKQARWSEWETEADTLMSHQDYASAAKLYTKIIDESKLKDKSDFKPLYKRAVSYYSAGDLDHALTDVDKFITEFPESAQPRLLRALINRQKEDEEAQLTDLQKAIDLGNSNPQLIYWRGTLLAGKGENEKAKKDFLYVRSIGDDAELETALGSVYRALGKTDSAFICLNNAIVLDVNYSPSYVYAGSFCVEDENYDLALKYLNLALRVDAENISAIFYKGVALVQQEKLEEGCSCLRKALDAGEDDAADYLKEFCFDVFK